MSSTQKAVSREFVRLKDLTGKSKSDPGATIEQMARLLETSKLRGSIQFRLLEGDKEQVHAVTFGKGRTKAHKERIPKPDLEITVALKDWWEIAKGTISPLEIVGRGHMHLRGDYNVGLRVLAHLAANEGRLTLCG